LETLNQKRVKLRILIITKRQYTNKDLIDDKYGRLYHLPVGLGRIGHDVKVLCLSYQRKAEIPIRDENVLWNSCDATIAKFFGLVKYIVKANKMAADADIIIAASDSFFGIIGFLIAKLHKIPLIFDLYDNFEFFFLARLPLVKQLYRAVVRKCEGVTCVSNPLSQLVRSYGRRKSLIVLENAVQPGLFKPMSMLECRKALHLPENGRLVGTAGAIHSNRGISVLFDAVDQLKKEFLDLWLVLAGPCHVDIPHESKIIYLGNLEESKVAHVWNALDVAVICIKENEFGKYCFPQKAREIMACDTPLIAANIGAMRDLLSGYPQEWLFQPNNKMDLVRAITLRFQDRRTGYSGVKTWGDITVELEKFLKDILQINRSG
jgi:glycosyltransferase involved in cell wall biosynthesis